jgi:hypothetical protein
MWAGVTADVAQYLRVRGHCHAAVDVGRIGPAIAGVVQDEPDFGLYWAAGEDADLTVGTRWILTDRPQEVDQRALSGGSVDGDAHGAGLAVAHHQDDGIGEAGVSHHRRGDEELAGQGRGSRRDVRRRGRRGDERYRPDRCDEGDDSPSGNLGRRVWAGFVFHVKHRAPLGEAQQLPLRSDDLAADNSSPDVTI